MSDLADALRNLDDTRKQKNDAARELKELKYASTGYREHLQHVGKPSKTYFLCFQREVG